MTDLLLNMTEEFRQMKIGNGQQSIQIMNNSQKYLIGVHPETPYETLFVSNSETRDFSSWKGNRGVVRGHTSMVRLTSKPEY
jgi:hypothetical protein